MRNPLKKIINRQNYRRGNLELGMCANHKVPRALGNKRYCEKCSFIRKVDSTLRFRGRHKKGICAYCDVKVSATNKRLCEMHRLENIKRMRDYNQNRRKSNPVKLWKKNTTYSI